MHEIPQLGKIYDCFDDGKINKGRQYKVKVESVISFDEIDNETLELWEREVDDCPFLYRKNTDFFAIGMNEKLNKKEIFVRTTDNGWFGIGGFLSCGRLDINGSLVKLLS